MESENPDDRQRVEAADVKREKKRESDRKYREKQKKKQESNEAQLQNLVKECSRYKKRVDQYEKTMKPLLDGACETRKLVLGPGESSEHARDVDEKQADLDGKAHD